MRDERAQMAVDLARLSPRRPRALNQAIQDRYCINHYEAAGVLAEAIRSDELRLGWDGLIYADE